MRQKPQNPLQRKPKQLQALNNTYRPIPSAAEELLCRCAFPEINWEFNELFVRPKAFSLRRRWPSVSEDGCGGLRSRKCTKISF